MKNTYVITIEEYDQKFNGASDGNINIYETEGHSWDTFDFENFKITSEIPDTDNEDFNDTARWLAKTLLVIRELEEKDPNFHCDWSAEDEYEFNVTITKKENKND